MTLQLQEERRLSAEAGRAKFVEIFQGTNLVSLQLFQEL